MSAVGRCLYFGSFLNSGYGATLLKLTHMVCALARQSNTRQFLLIKYSPVIVFSSSSERSCVEGSVDEHPPYCLLINMQLEQFLWSMEVSTFWRAVKYYVERRFRLDGRFLLELSPIDNVH